MQSSVNPHRAKLILVMGIFALPVLASYLAYFVWQPQGAARNYGALIQPVTLAESVTLATPEGTQVPLKSLRGKWLLLHVDSAACAQACEQKLYVMRQVRLMQGREQERVQRLWLIEDGQAPRAALNKEYEGTQWLTDPQRAVIGKLAAEGDVKQHIYMIDPLGNVMMRWPANPDMKRMFKDIERLLKASQIG
jgi:hypothetical protein